MKVMIAILVISGTTIGSSFCTLNYPCKTQNPPRFHHIVLLFGLIQHFSEEWRKLTMRATKRVLNGSIVETPLLCGSPIISRNYRIYKICDIFPSTILVLTSGNFLLQLICNLFGLLTAFPFTSFIACFSSGRRRRVFRILKQM